MRLQYVSPLTLPKLDPASMLVTEYSGVCIEPPALERRLLRYAPEFIDDPGRTKIFSALGAATYRSPAPFLTILQRPMLFGYRYFQWSNNFCNDEAGSNLVETEQLLAHLSSDDPFPNEDTGLRPAANGDGFDLDVGDRSRQHFDGTAVVLCSHEPSNYGSFLFRVLPKLHAVRAYGLGHLPVVVWAHQAAFVDFLRLSGVPEKQIIQHDTHSVRTFNRVIAPSLRNPHGFLDHESHTFFQKLARQETGVRDGRRLYISRIGQTRRGVSTRQMLNEPEVSAAMQSLGFEVIEPETLTPAQQIDAFSSAEIVVGPSGSAMFNIVFCKPGTKVIDIESEPNWIYAHTGLFASCHLRYGLFVGQVDPTDPMPVHRRFTVDVPSLVERIKNFQNV